MRNIMVSGLSERHISKLLPDVDNVELGYSNIMSVMLIPESVNETKIIFIDNEKYNKIFPTSIDGVFKILSE